MGNLQPIYMYIKYVEINRILSLLAIRVRVRVTVELLLCVGTTHSVDPAGKHCA